MTIDEMYSEIRQQVITENVPSLAALHKVLIKASCVMLPYTKGENHLYIRVDVMPTKSVEQIIFLASANNLKSSFTALNSKLDELNIPLPYLKVSIQ